MTGLANAVARWIDRSMLKLGGEATNIARGATDSS